MNGGRKKMQHKRPARLMQIGFDWRTGDLVVGVPRAKVAKLYLLGELLLIVGEKLGATSAARILVCRPQINIFEHLSPLYLCRLIVS